MSALGTRVPQGSTSPAGQTAPADPATRAPRTARTPYWLLWSTGIAAAVLGLTAFLLWGLGGAGTLLDMIIAFCT